MLCETGTKLKADADEAISLRSNAKVQANFFPSMAEQEWKKHARLCHQCREHINQETTEFPRPEAS